MLFISKNRTVARMFKGSRYYVAAVVAPLVAFTLGACDIDSILEVELPGDVAAENLDNPILARTLVISGVADFECALVDNIAFAGLWFGETLQTSGSRVNSTMGLRSTQIGVYADPCSTTGPVWAPLQAGRSQSQRAIELINGFPEGSVEDRSFLLATARLYEGYSIQLLGETHCGVTFDGGPLMTREEAWAEAEDRFTQAIELAAGSSAARSSGFAGGAAEVRIAAYIGRARARLNMGNNPTGVLADVSQVPEGFEFAATYDPSPDRRTNRIFEDNNEGHSIMPHRDFLDMTLSADGRLTVGDGVPDPRVVILPATGFGNEGIIPARDQQKYLSRSAPIPFATWREAQLMIAEVEGGQTAVDIINELRAKVSEVDWVSGDHPSLPLPQFNSADPDEIERTVREERRRDLWFQGHFIGDKLRWGAPFETADEKGQPLGPGGCLLIPLLETNSNPNL